MDILKKFKFQIFLLIVFLITRLVNLGIIPIFTDEAIYTYWSQIALNDPVNRFVSLEDGKQPLFIWLAAISQNFVSDPLIATRLVSVFSGLATVFGIYLLSKKLFSVKVAKLASLLYIILPFGLLYDRLALYDSLLTATMIFGVYFSIKLAQNPNVLNALLVGLFFGLGLITKSSALLFLLLLPASLVLLNFDTKKIKKLSVRWIIFAGLSFFIAQVIYNLLRISPLFYMVDRKNYTFIRPLGEFLKEPFSIFVSNSTSMVNWQISYLGLPLFLVFIFGSVYAVVKFDKKLLLMLVYILFPFFVEVFFNIVLYPRFMLFYYPYVLILISVTLWQLSQRVKNKLLISSLMLLFILFPAHNSYLLLTDPPKAKIASSDNGQYIADWPSGYGVKEIVDRLKQESKTENIYVATEGTFGLLPFAMQVYFYGSPNPVIEGFWPLNPSNLPQQVADHAKSKKTYVVLNENQKEVDNKKLKLVGTYKKGNGISFMRLYEYSEK